MKIHVKRVVATQITEPKDRSSSVSVPGWACRDVCNWCMWEIEKDETAIVAQTVDKVCYFHPRCWAEAQVR